MRPNASQLALRDPALAAALGAMPGPNYGHEASFGHAHGGQPYDPYSPYKNAGFGLDPNFGYAGGFGVDAPAPHPGMPAPHPGHHPGHHGHHPAAHPAHPHHAAWLQHYNAYFQHHGMVPFYGGRGGWYGHEMPHGPVGAAGTELWASEEMESARRARLLDPNEHSRVKIERYSFSFPVQDTTNGSQAFALAGGVVSLEGTLQPNTRIRPQRIVINAPVPNFVLLDAIQVANVNVLVGDIEDAYTYNANGQGVMLDLPTLDVANRATVSGSYTNLLPPGYTSDFAYTLIATFQGPSTLVGGF